MQLPVSIATRDRMLGFELFDIPSGSQLSQGLQRDIARDFKVQYETTSIRKGADLPEILNIVLNIGSQLAVGVAANWLYDKLKDKDAKISIERITVEFDKGEIIRVIKEKMEGQRP